MRTNKRVVFLSLVFVLLFSIGVGKTFASSKFVNYNDIEITSSEYNTLLNLGFNDDQIYYMTQEEYDRNKDLDAKLLAKTIKYYKTVSPTFGHSYTVEVSEEEYNNVQTGVVMRGSVDTTYKTVVSTISANGNKYRYMVTTAWKIMPSVHSYDIIGIGFSDYVHIDSSVYFSFTYANPAGSYTTSTQYYNKKSVSTGGAAVYKIPDSISALSANLYYDVAKDSGATVTNISMCGDYAHATSNVNVSNVGNYNIGITGINLGSGLSGHYDAIPCAMSSAVTSW